MTNRSGASLLFNTLEPLACHDENRTKHLGHDRTVVVLSTIGLALVLLASVVI
jgi:hypothetical protein